MSKRDAGNYLEIKRAVPTLTADGLLGTWRVANVPATRADLACPCAACADVANDADLGVLR
eukprot:6602770-Lingulodinium_polyedra.AAC.1